MKRASAALGRFADRVRSAGSRESATHEADSLGPIACRLSPNPNDCPLITGAHNCDEVQIQKSLDEGHTTDCNRGGGTALHVLLRNEFEGHLKSDLELQNCVELLVNSGCNVNQTDNDGETPLSLAVCNKFVGIVDYLLKKDADMTVRTPTYKKQYSLAVDIANHMPAIFEAILDDAVQRNDDTQIITLDWSPMLQRRKQNIQPPDVEANNNVGNVNNESSKRWFTWLLGADCETGFLYELLDIPEEARAKYLDHALVLAFMYLKRTRMNSYLTAYQLFMALFTVLYMVFLYVMYFDHCRIGALLDEVDDSGGDKDEGKKVVSHLQNCSLPNSLKAFGFILVLVAILLLLKEIFFLFRTDSTYLKNWTTWVTWISLLLMGLTLWPAIQFHRKSYNFSWHYPVASVGAFCAGILFLVHFDLIPKVKMYMEQIAGQTLIVLKIILLFTPIFVGLYVGFNIAFFEETRLMNFMLMSINAGSGAYENMIQEIADDGEARFFIVANIFCIAFILIIAIVFLNYLLAASVRDINEMKARAAIVVVSKEVETMYMMEVFGRNKFDLVTNSLQPEKLYDPNSDEEMAPEIREAILLLLRKKYGQLPTEEDFNQNSSGKIVLGELPGVGYA